MFKTSRLIPLVPNTPSKRIWQFFPHASRNPYTILEQKLLPINSHRQGIDLNAMGEVVVGRDAKVCKETGKTTSGYQWY